jgi:type VI secretion system protein ImpA
MSDLEGLERRAAGWLTALPDEAAPCGPDLEYDNDFLALTQALAGKPESQFGPAEPPDWRNAHELAESLLDRSRDLRSAIAWVRASLRLQGFASLPSGLRLLNGLVESHWDHLHPLPDPDDGDPYARVNALTVLTQNDGLLGDLRAAKVVDNRAIGELTVRAVELAAGIAPPRSDEQAMSREQAGKMLSLAIGQDPALRDVAEQSLELSRQLITLTNERLGSGVAPDLKPIHALLKAVVSVMPALAEDGAADADGQAGGDDGGASGEGPRSRRGLAGEVTSREEAIRAIDMVCAYLEAAEPANPAPLFLRRARQLISHNFLQLMKVLAPDSLSEVARVVGIDPDSVETPDGT